MVFKLNHITTDDQKEENVMKMKAKINFYIEKVGHHKNVVDFIGYVEDDVSKYINTSSNGNDMNINIIKESEYWYIIPTTQ